MLVTCPACRHQVSPKAPACPNCGHPFANPSRPPPTPVKGPSALRAMGIAFAIMVAVVVALYVFARYKHCSRDQSHTMAVDTSEPTLCPESCDSLMRCWCDADGRIVRMTGIDGGIMNRYHYTLEGLLRYHDIETANDRHRRCTYNPPCTPGTNIDNLTDGCPGIWGNWR